MIKLIKSTFHKEKDAKIKLCAFINKSKRLSMGSECEKFEKNFSLYQARKYCTFLNSGSSANLAIIQALMNLGKIKQDDLMGFSALTWSTNVMPLIQLGLKAVPIDVELDTLNVSSRKLLYMLEKYDIKALFLTNLLGFCDDIDEIKKVCEKKKIILIEDNCESLGTVYRGKKLGNYSLASTFSFYVGHHMSTVEGGAVCTDNEDLALMLSIVRAHGWDRNLSLESQNKIRDKFKINSTFYSRYTFYNLGYNLRPTEIAGFLGNSQLIYIDEIVKKRQQNFMQMAVPIYQKTNKYYPVRFSHIDILSNFAVPVLCKSKQIRDDLVKKCKGKVEIRPIVGGDMTRQPFFSEYENFPPHIFGNSNAKLIHEQGLYFGNNQELTEREMKSIIDIFCN